MELFTKEANKSLILKLPDYLYDTFKNNPDAQSTISINPQSLQLEISLPKSLQISSNGVLNFKAKLEQVEEDDLFVFSVDSQRKANLKTKVGYRANLVPERNLLYNQIVQEKSEVISDFKIQTAEPRRDDIKIQSRTFSLHEDHAFYVMANPEQAQRKQKDRYVRGDPERVKAMLFELFSNQRYWKLKALAKETKQPEQYLFEILKDIGEKGPQGPYKSQWQLKSEFRGSDESAEGMPVKKPKI